MHRFCPKEADEIKTSAEQDDARDPEKRRLGKAARHRGQADGRQCHCMGQMIVRRRAPYLFAFRRISAILQILPFLLHPVSAERSEGDGKKSEQGGGYEKRLFRFHASRCAARGASSRMRRRFAEKIASLSPSQRRMKFVLLFLVTDNPLAYKRETFDNNSRHPTTSLIRRIMASTPLPIARTLGCIALITAAGIFLGLQPARSQEAVEKKKDALSSFAENINIQGLDTQFNPETGIATATGEVNIKYGGVGLVHVALPEVSGCRSAPSMRLRSPALRGS